MSVEWCIAPLPPPQPTLKQLRVRYESAVSWEERVRIGLDQQRIAYARALLAGEPGDRLTLRSAQRLWRKALRSLHQADRELTGRLVQLQSDQSSFGAE